MCWQAMPSAGAFGGTPHLYRFLGMMGTSATCHLGSKPSVKKATPTSLAMLLTCTRLELFINPADHHLEQGTEKLSISGPGVPRVHEHEPWPADCLLK